MVWISRHESLKQEVQVVNQAVWLAIESLDNFEMCESNAFKSRSREVEGWTWNFIPVIVTKTSSFGKFVLNFMMV